MGFSTSRYAGAPALCGLFLSLTMVGVSVHAQDAATITARRNLLDQAQQASTAGDHRRALDLAERAGQIQTTPSLRLFVAQEQSALQMFAQATGTAELCVREAERDPSMRNREAILTSCRTLSESLRPRLGRVTVELASGLPDSVHVVVAGSDLNHALLGVPYTVNPGSVVIEATGAGYLPFHREVSVAAGANVPLRIEMIRDPSQVAAPVTTSSTLPPNGAASEQHGPGVAPWIVAGVGGAVLISSAVFFALLATNTHSFEQTYCAPPDYSSCFDSPAARDANGQLHLYSGVAIGTLVGGAVVAGAGVLWGVLGGRGSAPARDRAHVEFAPTQGGLIFGVGGSL